MDVIKPLLVLSVKRTLNINNVIYTPMKRIALLIFLTLSLLATSSTQAQNKTISVSGVVTEADTKQPIEQATIQLLHLPDSAYVAGVASLAKGNFMLPKVKAGKYVLKVSYIGLQTKILPLVLTNTVPFKKMGVIALESDAIMLQGAVVTAEAPEVVAVEDTLVYSSSAYRVPEGSMLEELVKKLPGAEVDEEGKITIHGKEIKKIMVDGKEFFTKDPKVAMKNLPVEMIDKIKAYDKQSDLTRVTGIDDGEEEAVLDLTVKKGMNQGWFGNLDLGAGSEDRYLGKAMLNRFAEGTQVTGIANFNNINDQGFGGGGFRRAGGGNSGLNAKKTTGVNFARDTKKLELGGSVNYSRSDQDVQTRTQSETFLQSGSSFGKSQNVRMNESQSLSADFRMEWRPDTLTNIIFRPSFSYDKTNNLSANKSITSQQEYLSDFSKALNEMDDIDELTEQYGLINQRLSNSHVQNNSLSTDGNLQINRQLGKKGRNITLRASYGYGDSDNEQYSNTDIKYYNNGALTSTNRFISNEGNNYNYRLQATYSEPVFTNRFLQFSYQYRYRYNETDKNTYNIVDGEQVRDEALSKRVENKYNSQEFDISLRTIRDKYQYNIGFEIEPQQSSTYYTSKIDTSIVRNVVNFTPTFDYRYKFNKQSQLRITYRGRTGQPSVNDLLPVVDNADPLNIKVGNPGLKPSYTNNFMFFYNAYLPEKQQGVMAHLSFSNTMNSVSDRTVYDQTTGSKTVTPENINGNWNVFGMFSFNTPFKNKKFTISTFTRGSYNNMVSFMQMDKEDSQKNTTRNLNLFERLRGSYRNNWFEFGLNAGLAFANSRNTLNEANDKETYDYSFGANTNVTLPWDVTVSTDGSYSMKRGYSEGLDRNEFIWNAQIAKNFLGKKQATISIQFYDILRQQTNLSRNISASMRSDSEYNSLNSYFMVHFIYRLNAFGGKAGKGRGGFNPPMGHPHGGPGRRPF